MPSTNRQQTFGLWFTFFPLNSFSELDNFDVIPKITSQTDFAIQSLVV